MGPRRTLYYSLGEEPGGVEHFGHATRRGSYVRWQGSSPAPAPTAPHRCGIVHCAYVAAHVEPTAHGAPQTTIRWPDCPVLPEKGDFTCFSLRSGPRLFRMSRSACASSLRASTALSAPPRLHLPMVWEGTPRIEAFTQLRSDVPRIPKSREPAPHSPSS